MVPALAVFCVVLVIVGVVINVPTVYRVWRDRRDYPNAPMIEGLMQGLCDEMEEKKCTDRGRDLAERTLRLMEESRWPVAERRLIAKTLVLQRIGYARKSKLRRTPAIRAAVVDQIEKLVMNSEYGLATVDFRSALACLRAQVAVDRWQYKEALGEIASMPIPEEREGMFATLGRIMAMRYFTHLDMIIGSKHHGYFSAIVHKRLMPHLKLDPSEVLVAVMTKHGGVSFPLALAELGAPAEDVEASARACFAWQFEHFNALRDAAIAAGGQVAVMRNRWDAGYSLCRLLALPFSFTDEARRMFAKYVEIREWELAYVVIQNFPEVFDEADRGTVFHGLGEDVLTKEDDPSELPRFDEITIGESFNVVIG